MVARQSEHSRSCLLGIYSTNFQLFVTSENTVGNEVDRKLLGMTMVLYSTQKRSTRCNHDRVLVKKVYKQF